MADDQARTAGKIWVGDKAFDNNRLRADLKKREAIAIISAKADRVAPIPHDKETCNLRRLVENFYCKIKVFRRITTWCDKTDACFAGFINLVAAFLWLR